MVESSLRYLYLQTPILYKKAPVETEEASQPRQNGTETLFCYNICPSQGDSIEPRRELFLGSQVFAGQKSPIDGDLGENSVFLPMGLYLFTQEREFLEKEQWLEMAIEQQKDGLWERNKLGSILYLRRLYEDGADVTQVIRPVVRRG